MKLLSLLLALCLQVGIASPSVVSNQLTEVSCAPTTVSDEDAKAAVAAYYGISSSLVQLGAKFTNAFGQDVWPFKVPSLEKSGIVTATATGLIVDDEANGF